MGMLSFANIVKLVVSFSLGVFLGMITKTNFESKNFVLAEWREPPMIIICPSSGVSGYRVDRAIEWWGIRNKKIAGYHFDHDGDICNKGQFLEGMVFIRGKAMRDPSLYATTARFTIGFRILSADIHLPNRRKNMPRLLEHEIGHALGFGHVEVLGHMMHPIHEMGGESFWIPD